MAEYEETYVGDKAGRSVEEGPYEEAYAYENPHFYENDVPELPSSARPPRPAIVTQQVAANHENANANAKTTGLKWLTLAFVVTTVIFAAMFAAVFALVMIPSGRDASENLANQVQDEKRTNELLETIEILKNNITSLQNLVEISLNRSSFVGKNTAGWYLASDGLFYKRFNEQADYTTAQGRCMNHGGRLLTKGLRSAAVVKELIDAGLLMSNNPVRIGYNDIRKENSWEWLDGGKTNTTVVQWSPGEPNNAKGNEDCASIRDIYNGKVRINDFPCTGGIAYVCEV